MENGGRELARVGNECQSFFQKRRSEKFSAEFFFRIKVFVLCPSRLFLSLLINFPTKQSFPPLKILQETFVSSYFRNQPLTTFFLILEITITFSGKKKKYLTKIYKIHLHILDHPETSVSDETSDCFTAPPPSLLSPSKKTCVARPRSNPGLDIEAVDTVVQGTRHIFLAGVDKPPRVEEEKRGSRPKFVPAIIE